MLILPSIGTKSCNDYWFVTQAWGGIAAAMSSVVMIVFCWLTTLNSVVRPLLGNSGIFLIGATVYTIVVDFSLVALFQTMLRDPGVVPLNVKPVDDHIASNGWCEHCASFKPKRAHHDSVTGRCVVNLDHYCPWTNNAVGVFNHKCFILFIVYSFLSCCCSGLGCYIWFATCNTSKFHTNAVSTVGKYIAHTIFSIGNVAVCIVSQLLMDGSVPSTKSGFSRFDIGTINSSNSNSAPTHTALEHACKHGAFRVLLVCVLEFLFGLFTFYMLVDQFYAIYLGENKIARLKMLTVCQTIGSHGVFGSGNFVCRFLPFPAEFSAQIKAQMMGYDSSMSVSNHLHAQGSNARNRSEYLTNRGSHKRAEKTVIHGNGSTREGPGEARSPQVCILLVIGAAAPLQVFLAGLLSSFGTSPFT